MIRSHGNVPARLLKAENTTVFAPPEVPTSAVQKMFEVVSSRFKEQITEEDILKFSQKNLLGFTAEKVAAMVNEALTTGFGFTPGIARRVHEPQNARNTKKPPPKRFLTVKDVSAALRTRKDPEEKSIYLERPYRKQWIALIQAAHPGERIFSFPQVHCVAPPLALTEQWQMYEDDLKDRKKSMFEPHLYSPQYDHTDSVFSRPEVSYSAFADSSSKLSLSSHRVSKAHPGPSFKRPLTGFSQSRMVNDYMQPIPIISVSPRVQFEEDPAWQDYWQNSSIAEEGAPQNKGGERPRSYDGNSKDQKLSYKFSRTMPAVSAGSLSCPSTAQESRKTAMMLSRTSMNSTKDGNRSIQSRTLAPSYVSRGTKTAQTLDDFAPKRRPYSSRVDGLLPEEDENSVQITFTKQINNALSATQQTGERSNQSRGSFGSSPVESPRIGFGEKDAHLNLLNKLQSMSIECRKEQQAHQEAALRMQERHAALSMGQPLFKNHMGDRTLSPQHLQDRKFWAQDSLIEAKKYPMKKTEREEVVKTGVFDYSLLKHTSAPQEIKSKVSGDQASLYGRSLQAYYARYDEKPYEHTFRKHSLAGEPKFKHQPIPIAKAFPHEKLATILSTDGTDHVRNMRESGWKLDKQER